MWILLPRRIPFLSFNLNMKKIEASKVKVEQVDKYYLYETVNEFLDHLFIIWNTS